MFTDINGLVIFLNEQTSAHKKRVITKNKGCKRMSKEKTTKQAPANTVKAADGVEIYTSKIYELVDDYINTLPDPEELKTNNGLFTGMLKHIYINYIGHLLGNKDIKNTVVHYNDIELLNNLFIIYCQLVYKYKANKRPLILEFSIFTNIARDTFTDWKNNNTRALTPEYSHTVKSWFDECENALVNGSSVFEIFLLKANYNYNDVHVAQESKQAALLQADALPVFGLGCENNSQSAQKIIDVDTLENE